MKSILIGTAGHIDHGKTALVKALTGIDADRLEEEKRRGITIDLGFAHAELPGPNGERLRFGFVDVPGHERFVRNMLAGVGGIDVVLLVIAADEGIKPQTREHFDICRLLSIPRGIVVLTKSDLVDADTLAVLRLEVEDFLRGSFLESSAIVAVSALKSTGLDDLNLELVRLAAASPMRDFSAMARLPIDRVFTMKGFGTVVTGTLVAGTIVKDSELALFPANNKIRVRGVQVHGIAAERAVAGERTALNLAGIDKNEVARGMMLAEPAVLQTSTRVDARLLLLPSARPLKTGARVHLHAFTSEVIATIRIYEDKLLLPGKEAYAQLHLSHPLLLLPGDRFIMRQFSPVITIGGGVVLDAFPLKRAPASSRTEFLNELFSGNPARILKARVARRAQRGLDLKQAVAETGWQEREIASQLASLEQELVKAGGVLIMSATLRRLSDLFRQSVEQFQQRNPLSGGIPLETLRDNLAISQSLFDFVLDSLLRDQRLVITAGLIHLPGHGVTMKDDEAESRQRIEQAFLAAGLQVPALKDVLAGLKIDKVRAQKIVTLLLREKVLVKVSDDLVFHQSALAGLRSNLAVQKLKSPRIDVAGFKSLTGVSRKYAIPLLEYLDRERVTRRVGEQRVIL
jgi:selenocysteine-specific elongation factor